MQQTKPESGLTNSAKIMQELDVLKNKLDKKLEHAQLSTSTSTPTYAEITGKDRLFKKPSHAVIISSENDAHTSSSILEDVRKVIDARTTGIQIQNVRKAKWQKVVITCKEKADLITIKEKLNKSKLGYQVEEAKFKDPLVIIRDVLSYNTDDDILKSLRSQNAHITSDIPQVDYRASVKYRKRARNPLECHVILQVSPVLWQRMTTAGQLHIDMQRRPVYDQSPLLQCTRCLGFGHGRRHCTEVSDLCSHCSGPHLRKDCPLWLADAAPTCRNCLLGKQDKHEHGAFDVKCPVRQRWDTLARTSVSYG